MTEDVVDEVKRLLASGLSARAVARLTGASRGSVANIANGTGTNRFADDVDCVADVRAAALVGVDPPSVLML